jgi:hypothetical protein
VNEYNSNYAPPPPSFYFPPGYPQFIASNLSLINNNNQPVYNTFFQSSFYQTTESSTVVVMFGYNTSAQLSYNITYSTNSDGSITTFNFINTSTNPSTSVGTVTCTKLYNNGTQTGCTYSASSSSYINNYTNMSIIGNMGLANAGYNDLLTTTSIINDMFALGAYPLYQLYKSGADY